jgi:hypothetical protein
MPAHPKADRPYLSASRADPNGVEDPGVSGAPADEGEGVDHRVHRLRTWRQDHSRGAVWLTGGTLVLAVNALAAATIAFGPTPVHLNVHLHLLPPKRPPASIPDAAALASGPPLTVPLPTTTTLPAEVTGPRPPGWSGVAPTGGGAGGVSGGGGGGGSGAASSQAPAGTRLADSDTRSAIAHDAPPLSGTTVDYLVVSQHDATWALEHLVGSPDVYRVLQQQPAGWTVTGQGQPGSLCTGGAPPDVQADFSPLVAAC